MDQDQEVEALVRQELTARIVELRQEIYHLKQTNRELQMQVLQLKGREEPPDYGRLLAALSWAKTLEEVAEITSKFRAELNGENNESSD